MKENQPTYTPSLAEYFRKQLQELAQHVRPTPDEDTLWYTGNMLARFGNSDALFSYDQGEVSIRPLALLYKDAHETDSRRERCLILRQLGDLALFLGALFPENYARRGINKDYFIGMGGGAYDYLSEHSEHQRHIFSELAATFTRMLELIARACSRNNVFDSSDVLQIYARWQETGDPRLASQLQMIGISVNGGGELH